MTGAGYLLGCSVGFAQAMIRRYGVMSERTRIHARGAGTAGAQAFFGLACFGFFTAWLSRHTPLISDKDQAQTKEAVRRRTEEAIIRESLGGGAGGAVMRPQ